MATVAESWHTDGRLRGGGIVATVMSNLGLERYLGELGLKTERTQVGDRHVVEHMRANNFNVGGEQGDPVSNHFGSRLVDQEDVYGSFLDSLASGSISGSCNGLRNRIKNIQFNNTTELNSTIYFCRANHNEFNYSSNPTYVNSSKIQVKETSLDNPISYITTVGLYSADNELLAVAKLSEPLKKDPTNELTLRVRLDY